MTSSAGSRRIGSGDHALTHLLDESGMELILPVARWKGYGGETNFEGALFETIT